MKIYTHYQLVQIDFKNNHYKYCDIIVHKISKSTIQVISHTGKLGNKGRKIVIFETPNNYKNLQISIEHAKEHMRDKKKIGFMFKRDVEDRLKNIYKNESRCDLCGDYIKEELYKKINQFARSCGWDNNKNHIGYKKVLCITCQMENNLFKKRRN